MGSKTVFITKSDFILFLEAPLHLWAKMHGKLEQKAPSAYDQHLMRQGYEVEKLAQKFVEILASKNYNNYQVIWQETYLDNQFSAKADAVVYDGKSGVYDLYEIKSSSEVKTEHLYDVTFQALVCEHNMPIRDVFIVHLNKEYIKKGKILLEELFVAENVTTQVNSLKEEVRELRQNAIGVAQKSNHKNIVECTKPKDCPCIHLCHPKLPERHIYEIPYLSEKKARELKNLGVLQIKDIPDNFSLTPNQLLHTKTIKAGKPTINTRSIKDELGKLEFPLYFLDYESYNSAVPQYDGYKPHQQMVFQYSLHILEKDSNEILHEEYICIENCDPAQGLINSLREKINKSGTIIVWNKTFEEGRNKEMANLFPEHSEFLLNVNARMYDLAESFKKGFHIHPDFHCSWSIKNILPIMVPNLNYKELTVAKGDEAMLAWWKIVSNQMEKNKQKQMIKDLLKYCELDSYAMYAIWKELDNLVTLETAS